MSDAPAAVPAAVPAPCRTRLRFWRQPPVAFVTALLIAPLAVALLGLVTLPIAIGFIILMSVPFGAGAYFGVFAPLAWYAHLKGARGGGDMALVGFGANLIAGAILGVWLVVVAEERDAMDIVRFVHGFGLVFAPLYGAIFGLAFSRLLRQKTSAAPNAASTEAAA